MSKEMNIDYVIAKLESVENDLARTRNVLEDVLDVAVFLSELYTMATGVPPDYDRAMTITAARREIGGRA